MHKLHDNQINAWITAYFATPAGTDPAKMADYVIGLLEDRGAFDDSWGGHVDVKDVAAHAEKLATAVGDVVNVPPHWHVRLSVNAARSTGPLSSTLMLAGDKIEFVSHGAYGHTVELTENAYEQGGLIVFDVVLPFKPHMQTSVRICNPRPGVAASATIISIT